ncbi:MAG: bifunctional diaminohydroxyphosphoribosylaminopyrimidine deaminase/5-amino-6-(5-phosphoribosylamino)uracil reductase RibD [Sporichthyaceae bacterium]
MSNEAELAAMRRAIELAAHGLGATNPNPIVGAVILDAAGEPVGEGFHAVAGGPHAEVVALAQAGERARGSTAVVTLEPCNHTGRTGPCAQALIAAGVARVVFAVRDPNPTAAGGASTLADAGIEVEAGLLADEAERLNEAWLTSQRLGRPFVTWKYAASLDGRTAAADGTSRWITSAESRADVHRLRAEVDAIVVGSGTVLADDPHLAVRKAPLRHGPPLRVVLDSNARTPTNARILDDAAETLILVAEDAVSSEGAVALRKAGADVVAVPRHGGGVDRGGLDLNRALAVLHACGVVSVLLEGGAHLAGSFLAERLVDRVVGYVAPALIGGGGLPALAGPGAPTIDAALRLRLDEIVPIGPDVRLTARPVAWRS